MPEVSLRVNDDEYQRLRNKILERDGGSCIDCGYSSTNEGARQIHVHHVIPERLFGQQDPHYPENMVTLCSTCHGAWEKEFRAMMQGRPAWDQQVRNRVKKKLGDDIAVLAEHFPEVYEMVADEVNDAE